MWILREDQAGLFSSVVTTFLVEASQNLQADFTEMTTVLLFESVAIQRAMLGNQTSLAIPSTSLDPTRPFVPDRIDVWVNGLWVVSLIASLVVALASVLVKQWLHHYLSHVSGDPGLRSHTRRYRFMGLEKWNVNVIIGILPIIMHVSLVLFLAGLVLFYVPLRISLAWTVGVVTVVACVLYVISNVIPIYLPQCPYHTPLTEFFHYVLTVARISYQSVLSRGLPDASSDPDPALYSRATILPDSSAKLEKLEVKERYDELSVDALDWLFTMSSNPSVRKIVLQAVGGLPPTYETMQRSHGTIKTKYGRKECVSSMR